MKKRVGWPRLSRGQKIFINLAIALVCGVALWGWLGYPLPTAELEFRRLERQMLMDDGGTLYQVNAAGEDYFVSVSEDRVNVARKRSGGLYVCAVEEGGSLVPINSARRDLGEYAVLAVGVPEEAAQAQMTLDLSTWSGEWYQSDVTGENEHLIDIVGYHEADAERYTFRHHSWDYQVNGERLGPGVFLFCVTPQGHTENQITGTVDALAERKALQYITAEYKLGLLRPDRDGLTELVFQGSFYNKEGELVRELRLAPLEKFE